MIISIEQLLYDARNGEKRATIEIEIKSWSANESGVIYTVNDYAVNGDVREFISTKDVPYSWDQINSLNDYLNANYDYSGLNKRELEFAKIKHGLLLETQTRPVYGSTPQVWVLTENLAE